MLFQRLFGFQIEIDKPSTPEIVGNFVTAWSDLYQVLESLAKARFPNRNFRGTNAIIPELIADGYLDAKTVDEIRKLRMVRNDVVHGNIKGVAQGDDQSPKRINETTSAEIGQDASAITRKSLHPWLFVRRRFVETALLSMDHGDPSTVMNMKSSDFGARKPACGLGTNLGTESKSDRSNRA